MAMFEDRVLSGMRPTGRMHIGHYHGALKNWVRLQEQYECLFFAADWHALTTHYDSSIVSSACCGTRDWMKSVAFVGSMPHASQSTNISHTVCSMTCGSS